jgi:hypothetical protein
MPRVVHLLEQGNALCGLKRIEGAWPPGHTWAAPSDLAAVSCLACRRAHDVAASTIGAPRAATPSARGGRGRRTLGP